MAACEHSRSRCRDCETALVHLTGDPCVGYEDIEPVDGGPPTLVEHTATRCQFHQFLTPVPGQHVLPGNANWLDHSLVEHNRAGVRWSKDT